MIKSCGLVCGLSDRLPTEAVVVETRCTLAAPDLCALGRAGALEP